MNEGKAEGKKPQRGFAILLALIGPWGIGHFYLGQPRRAVAWLVLSAVALVLFALLLQPLGAVLGYGTVLALLIVSIPLAWTCSRSRRRGWRPLGSSPSSASGWRGSC